jgi:hypothetical protein
VIIFDHQDVLNNGLGLQMMMQECLADHTGFAHRAKPEGQVDDRLPSAPRLCRECCDLDRFCRLGRGNPVELSRSTRYNTSITAHFAQFHRQWQNTMGVAYPTRCAADAPLQGCLAGFAA